jgi:hypothetical protein
MDSVPGDSLCTAAYSLGSQKDLSGMATMRAYIVVATEPGRSRDIARQVASLAGVKMADACWGSRDVFAVVEVRGLRSSTSL